LVKYSHDPPAARRRFALLPAEPPVSRSFPPVVWGMYLGISWTWVIGMFLPVLLVRDYGPLAWWIFAIPNCIGAAAMGWVLRNADDSAAYVRRHAGACRWFSLVTIAFHLFFAAWMLPHLVGPVGGSPQWSRFNSRLRRSSSVRRRAVSIGVFAVSVAAASVMGLTGALELPAPKAFPMAGGGGAVARLFPRIRLLPVPGPHVPPRPAIDPRRPVGGWRSASGSAGSSRR
jgi:hypothetical protein